MGNQKVTELTALTTLDPDDIIYVVDDPAGSPLSRKMTMENVVKAGFGAVASDILVAHTVLHDETLSGAGVFDVSDISQAFDDLLIVLTARSTVAATGDSSYIFFNNDTTTTNYHRQFHIVGNAAHAVGESADPYVGSGPAATSTAGSFGLIHIYIPKYTNTNYLKLAMSAAVFLNSAATMSTGFHDVIWEDGGTTAINRIQLRPDGYPTDNYATNSNLRIYGIGQSG